MNYVTLTTMRENLFELVKQNRGPALNANTLELAQRFMMKILYMHKNNLLDEYLTPMSTTLTGNKTVGYNLERIGIVISATEINLYCSYEAKLHLITINYRVVNEKLNIRVLYMSGSECVASFQNITIIGDTDGIFHYRNIFENSEIRDLTADEQCFFTLYDYIKEGFL